MSEYERRITSVNDQAYVRSIVFEVKEEGDTGPSLTVRVLSTITGGSPEGVEVGSPGDVRIRADDIGQIWLKATGVNTKTGWIQCCTQGGGVAVACNDDPQPNGVASPGVSAEYSRCDHVHPAQNVPVACDGDPQPDGVASPGVSAEYSRCDHVHPAQGGAFAPVAAEYEVVFANFADQAIAPGSQMLDGLDVWAGPGGGYPANTSLAIVNGTGLRFDCSSRTVNTVFNTSVRSAVWFGFSWASLYARLGVDPTAILRCEVYMASRDLPVASSFVMGWSTFGGAPDPPSVPAGGNNGELVRIFSTGGQSCFTSVGTGGVGGNRFVNGVEGPDVIGIAGLGTMVPKAIGGFWSGAWPPATWTQEVASSGVGPAIDPLDWLVMAMPTGSTNGDPVRVDVQRMRVRAYMATPW